MKWVRRSLGAVVSLMTLVFCFGIWVAEPWSNQRPMRTWSETLPIQILG